MLLRRQPGLLGRRLTERKKPPELKPKLGESFVIDDSEARRLLAALLRPGLAPCPAYAVSIAAFDAPHK